MTSFSRTSRIISIVTATLGGLTLLGVGGTAAITTVGAVLATGQSLTLINDVPEMTKLDVESDAAEFTLVFADVAEATLEVEDARNNSWSMEFDDGELSVSRSGSPFTGCIGWCGPSNERVTLTLPSRLSTGQLDAELEVNSGNLVADGNFRNLGLTLNAGVLRYSGVAHALNVEVSAGFAELEAASVSSAEFDVSAGRLSTTLTGTNPRAVTLNVDAGIFNLTLPSGAYQVYSDVSAGILNNWLGSGDPTGTVIHATVAAGVVNLRAE